MVSAKDFGPNSSRYNMKRHKLTCNRCLENEDISEIHQATKNGYKINLCTECLIEIQEAEEETDIMVEE